MRPPTPRLTKDKPWKVLSFKKGDPTLVGYARVSTREQHLDVQIARLQDAGCCKVYCEKVSGAAGQRPGWTACLESLRPKDVLCVLRVDRAGRRLSELVLSLDEIRDLGAHVRSLEEGIDTRERGGRFAFNLNAAFAEKHRDDISQNTAAGMARIKAQGIKVGKPTLLTPPKLAQLEHLRGQGFSLRQIAGAVGLGRTTVKKGLELAAHLRGDARQLRLGGVK